MKSMFMGAFLAFSGNKQLGMPLEDDTILGRDRDGALNEDYCKWCYADGTYTYSNMDDLIDVCVKHMVNENFSEEQACSYMRELLLYKKR